MSTKIYDAYLLPEGANVLVANLAVAEGVRPVYQRLALRAVALAGMLMYSDTTVPLREQAERALHSLMGFADLEVEAVNHVLRPFGLDHGRVSNLRVAAAVVQVLNTEAGMVRIDPSADLQVTVSWMVDPQPSPDGGHHQFAKVYTERKEYVEAFLEATGATDFHYQNQTDRPDDVTDAEWESRRVIWGRVLGSEAPATFSPAWELLDVKHLEFETWRDGWLTAEAVCDELEAQGVFKPGGRAKFETWLAEKPESKESSDA